MQEAIKVSEEQIAANVREAVYKLNGALEAAEKAGLKVVWSMDEKELVANVRKAAAAFNAALDEANKAGIQTGFTIKFSLVDGVKRNSRIDLTSLKFVKDLPY